MVSPPTLVTKIALGRTTRLTSAKAALTRTEMRKVFMAPDVEPTIPPTNMSPMSMIWRAGRQSPKSVLLNPVPVATDTVLNVPVLMASAGPSLAQRPPMTITQATMRIDAYSLNSELSQ